MGKNRHNDLLLKQQFQKGFQRQHSASVAQGAYAMCKVIYDKAVDASKTAENALIGLRTFAVNCLSLQLVA